MLPSKSFFKSITYYDQSKEDTPTVLLGDETTRIPVVGSGLAVYKIQGKIIRKHALLVPDLGTTALISVVQHMSNQGCYFHAEAKNTVLAFPTFIVYPKVDHEIDVQLTTTLSTQYDFDDTKVLSVLPDRDPLNNTDSSRPDHEYTTRQFNYIHPTIKSHIPDPSKRAAFQHKVLIKKLHPRAAIPTKGTEGSIGLDVSATTTTTILPGSLSTISTGLATAFPSDVYLCIAPRSSISKQQISVEAGVIDSDYRGEIKVLLQNNSNHPFIVNAGDKIAQFIFEKAATPLLLIRNQLPATTRNNNGFRSTNKNTNTSTFRINDNEIIIVNNTKHNIKAKRVHAPIVHPIIHSNHPQFNMQQQHNIVNLHEMNGSEATVVDQALQMNIKRIPFSRLDHSLLPSEVKQTTTTVLPPTTLPVYHPNSSQSQRVSMSSNNLLKSIGFLKPDRLKANIHKLGKKSFVISKLPREPALDPGEVATMLTSKRNTSAIDPPKSVEKIFNIDIVYGPCTAIGGARFALLAVNKKIRMNFVFPLKILPHHYIKQCNNSF